MTRTTSGMVECTCPCGDKFMSRKADLKRGWGRYCSKSCAARYKSKHKKTSYKVTRKNDWHPDGCCALDGLDSAAHYVLLEERF